MLLGVVSGESVLKAHRERTSDSQVENEVMEQILFKIFGLLFLNYI